MRGHAARRGGWRRITATDSTPLRPLAAPAGLRLARGRSATGGGRARPFACSLSSPFLDRRPVIFGLNAAPCCALWTPALESARLDPRHGVTCPCAFAKGACAYFINKSGELKAEIESKRRQVREAAQPPTHESHGAASQSRLGSASCVHCQTFPRPQVPISIPISSKRITSCPNRQTPKPYTKNYHA